MKNTKEILNMIAASWGFKSFAAWVDSRPMTPDMIEFLVADAIELSRKLKAESDTFYLGNSEAEITSK